MYSEKLFLLLQSGPGSQQGIKSRIRLQSQDQIQAEQPLGNMIFVPGGGGTQVQRGAAPSLHILRKKGSFFKTSACPRFCKRRVLFCTQVL